MKAIVPSKILRDLLGEMLPFAKTLKTEGKDIARSAVMDGTNGQLTMWTGDFKYNYYIERSMAAQVQTEGWAAFDIAQLIDVLSIMDGNVTLDISGKESGILVAGQTTLPIRGSADIVPRIPMPDSDWVTVEKAETLVDATLTADKCRRQDDDLAYDVNGIGLFPSLGGLELVGTDGNHMIAIETGASNCVARTTVCHPSFARALSCFDRRQPIEIRVGETNIGLRQAGRLNLLARLSGRNFPDNYQVIVDKNPQVVGVLQKDDATKIVKLLQRRIICATHQGLVKLTGANDQLLLQGLYKNSVFAAVSPGAAMPTISLYGVGLTKMLPLFDGPIELSISDKNQHLYLREGRKFAILRTEKAFN